MQLRYYQREAVSAAVSFIKAKQGNPLIALPTGAGKTAVVAELVRLCQYKWKVPVMVLTHVKELIEQLSDGYRRHVIDIEKMVPSFGVYSASVGRKDTRHSVVFGGIGSVINALDRLTPPKMIIIDEAHLVSPNDSTQYKKLIKYYQKKSGATVVGLTATPYRLGMGALVDGGIFDDICIDYTLREKFMQLVHDGYLSRLIPYEPRNTYDVSKVGSARGDYIVAELETAIDTNSLNNLIVDEIIEHLPASRSCLVFATTLQHARHVAEIFIQRGVRCEVVDGSTAKKLREKVVADFKEYRFKVLINVGVFTTGFDHPGVDLIAVLRPTKSPGLWVQILGRGLRICEGKTYCKVLDFGRNSERLGPINDPVLPKKRGAKKGEVGPPPMKKCYQCNAYMPRSALTCEACGFSLPEREPDLDKQASTAKLMAESAEDVTVKNEKRGYADVEVDGIYYARHVGPSGRAMLRVDYFVKRKRFSEWLDVEGSGYARKRAQEWWSARHTLPLPSTVEAALNFVEMCAVPKKITVDKAGKYAKIINYEWEE